MLYLTFDFNDEVVHYCAGIPACRLKSLRELATKAELHRQVYTDLSMSASVTR